MVASPRRPTSCAFLKGQIYRFGEHLPANSLEADGTLLVSDAEGGVIIFGWRRAAQIAIYVNGDAMVINHGFTKSQNIITQTIAYHASSNF